MPKKKERSSDEWYKSQIRELEKENRNLRKRVRELEKKEHFYDVQTYTEDTMPVEISTNKHCPQCSKGQIKELDIIGRIFEECNICDYRKKVR